uniref:Caspase recruitment domain family, member 14 n=1 Tax=Amphilophus citrinellus TaxID=61819 RepID=A0A3Q0TAQ1_AMPCI
SVRLCHRRSSMGEEELWELINDSRHRISLGVRPCILIPYLRQARVLSEMDEDEILSCHNLTNRCMRTSHMLDLLRTQGKNGAMALLESLMIHYPALYTQVTGRKPSTEPSRFSGEWSKLTEYLVRAVTGMQKELQEARSEAGKMSTRCASLEADISQMMEQEERSRSLQAYNERIQRHLCSLQHEVTKLKDEKCDLYIRYTAAIEEKSAVNERLHDLNLQVSGCLFCLFTARIFDFLPESQSCHSFLCFQAYQSRDEAQAMIARILAEKDTLRCQLVELQEKVFSLHTKRSSTGQQSSEVIFHTHMCSNILSRTSPPPFLMRSRPRAIRISGRVISISFQGEALLTQLTVVGGNKTGVFVHEVTEGSYEKNQKALRMVLEDSTLEEAMWALGQVTGVCHLSLRPRQDDYEALLQQLQSCETSSGDSFYVRANTSLPAGPGGTLTVVCNDILHVTNTRPAGTDDSWHASHVHPCQLLDLQSGTVPNYYRLGGRVIAQNTQKTVRIVGTGRQGRNPLWVSVEEEEDSKSAESDATSAPKSCVTLMPYTLVTPHYPPVCRPVLLLPSVLGRILDKKLASWQGFQLCEPEVLTSSEHAARLQKSEILEEVEQGGNSCYTLQSVEKVMKKVILTLLHLGENNDSASEMREPSLLFPLDFTHIYVYVRSKLHRHGQTEEQLLACSSSEEPLLDKLPCLYHSVDPDSWCDQASLLNSLRTIIWEEQKKIVWSPGV